MKIWFPIVQTKTGAQVYAERLCGALHDLGIDGEVTHFSQAAEFFPPMMRHHMVDDADIIHANTWNGFAFAGLNKPLVVTEHHSISDPLIDSVKSRTQRLYHSLLIARYIDKSLRHADAVVAVSETTATSIRRLYPHIHGVRTIYNWVDTTRFRPPPSRPDHKKPQLLFVGSLSSRKGADFLPVLADQLVDICDILFTTGGKPPPWAKHRPNLKPLVRRLSQSELIALYQTADLFIAPSRHEGFGYAPIEAMACGTPAVGFDIPVFSEIFGTLRKDLLTPAFDIQLLVMNIRRLLHNSTLRLALGHTCRQMVSERFNLHISISKYLELYRSLLNL